jgi:tRNAThr (cytosine32-N3)-methyltransferase
VKEAGEEKVTIFLHDLSSEDEIPVKPASIDAVICTFVLSAIPSETMKNAVAKMVRTLKPGGEIFFRDYGRHDMAQLRFKPGRVVGENFYSRG